MDAIQHEPCENVCLVLVAGLGEEIGENLGFQVRNVEPLERNVDIGGRHNSSSANLSCKPKEIAKRSKMIELVTLFIRGQVTLYFDLLYCRDVPRRVRLWPTNG
jgi:hypothetical protein